MVRKNVVHFGLNAFFYISTFQMFRSYNLEQILSGQLTTQRKAILSENEWRNNKNI